MPDVEDIEKTVPSSPSKRTPKKNMTPQATSPEAPAPAENAETQQIPAAANAAPAKPPRRGRRWVFGLIAGFIALVGLAALGGAQAGIYSRTNAEHMTRAIEAETQFQLAQADFENGHCDLARQRLEYVTELNPTHPGLVDALSRAVLCTVGAATPQPGSANGAEPTPTPDLRGRDQAYGDAQALLAARNWEELLQTLDTLRTNFPDFNPIEVDGMYFIAFRNRGVMRILPPVGDLEGGIYDLNRAAQIGPLDTEATLYRQWAVNYIIAKSFWEVDWGQAVQYFLPLADAAPNLHDINFFTVQERLATASAFYSLDLIDRAERLTRDEQWCSADELMREAAELAPLSPENQALADSYATTCSERGNG
ncbi:MAG: hypothetical protein KF701_10420 [Anaerolineales bacterium]|nr:MAG: hypothetical protein KF701_10420 [Anaerolineales bacterium]